MDAEKQNSTLKTAELVDQNRQKNQHVKTILFYLRESISILVWLSVFTKVFIYDVDLLVVNKLPILQRLYPYKFFFVIGLTAAVWLALGTKRAFKTLGYIATYPLWLILWRIPKVLFKNWALLFVFLPAIESVLITLKWRFVLASCALLAALAICLTMNRFALMGAMPFLGAYLLIHYILRLKVAFKTDGIFAGLAPAMGQLWRDSIKTYKTKEFAATSGPGAKPEDYAKAHIQNLKDLYTSNMLWSFLATKFEAAVSSRRTDLYFIVALIYSFALTVLVFAFEDFAAFKLNPSSFQTANAATFWTFLLFSFNAILHTNYATATAVSSLSITLANLEVVASLIIFLFFVFILLTSSRERYRQDLLRLATQMSNSSNEIERFFEKKLRMRLIDAEAKIIEGDPTFLGVMQLWGRQPISSGAPTKDNTKTTEEGQ